jgi:hypothetical protein
MPQPAEITQFIFGQPLRGHINVNGYTSAWVVELAEGRFTSPTLGIGLFNDLEDVLQRLHRGFQQEAEGSE